MEEPLSLPPTLALVGH